MKGPGKEWGRTKEKNLRSINNAPIDSTFRKSRSSFLSMLPPWQDNGEVEQSEEVSFSDGKTHIRKSQEASWRIFHPCQSKNMVECMRPYCKGCYFAPYPASAHPAPTPTHHPTPSCPHPAPTPPPVHLRHKHTQQPQYRAANQALTKPITS